jgi:lysophospholipase L1-like esterase
MATVEERPLEPPPGRRLGAREAMLVVGIAVALLVLFKGDSIRDAGEEMQPGLGRTVVLAVGRPTGWVADRLPFDELGSDAFAWIDPDDELGDEGGFGGRGEAVRAGTVPPVGADSFDPAELGEEPSRAPRLRTLLVTGDSLARPLDTELARRLAGEEVKVVRDPHVGTGVSKSGFVDWGKLSTRQVKKERPDATVVFIGANEGFPLPGPRGRKEECCGPGWAAAYAFRVRRMMNIYRRRGSARVYYLTLPLPRDGARQRIVRTVNAAIEVASEPYRAHVRVLDMERTFTPGGRYRHTLPVEGRERVVREPDGIHLNGTGADIAAAKVLASIRRDFGP